MSKECFLGIRKNLNIKKQVGICKSFFFFFFFKINADPSLRNFWELSKNRNSVNLFLCSLGVF